MGGTLLAKLNFAEVYDSIKSCGSATPTEGPGPGVQLLDQLLRYGEAGPTGRSI